MLNHLPTVGQTPVKPIPLKKFTPNGNLVALYNYPTKPTDAGIVLPDGSGAINQSPLALVVACGPDCKYVKEGDTVLLGHTTPQIAMVFHQKSTYWIVNEVHITGVVDPAFVGKDLEGIPREEK